MHLPDDRLRAAYSSGQRLRQSQRGGVVALLEHRVDGVEIRPRSPCPRSPAWCSGFAAAARGRPSVKPIARNTAAMIPITSMRTSVQRLAMPLHCSLLQGGDLLLQVPPGARSARSAATATSWIVPKGELRPENSAPGPLRQCAGSALRQSPHVNRPCSPVTAGFDGMPSTAAFDGIVPPLKTVIAGLSHRKSGYPTCGSQ